MYTECGKKHVKQNINMSIEAKIQCTVRIRIYKMTCYVKIKDSEFICYRNNVLVV